LLRDFLVANYVRLQQRLTRHLGCPDLASECLHDAWLRLDDLAVFASVHSPEAYVYRTACNAAMDRMRSNRNWQYAEGADTDLDYLADLGPGPDLIAEARSELAAVERALHRLPRRHRSVLAALRIEDATREEVATRFDLTLRRVDTVLRQALDHCAELAGRSVQGGVRRGRNPVATRASSAAIR
jgi:RNA polymerase sigma-70 factor (ECF subfamily)